MVGVLAAILIASVGYVTWITLGSMRSGLSWELRNAPKASNAQWRVYYWLRRNARSIANAEKRYNVDGAAIAGVIAYEALEDVHPVTIRPLARYSGPGKVHFKEFRYSEGEPMSKVAELRGYVAKVTMQQRARILATDSGSVSYIASIMAMYARAGAAQGYDLRCRADLLATFYSAWTLAEAQKRFRDIRAPLAPNRVGTWVILQKHFLQNAVQSQPISLCNRPQSHLAAARTGVR